MFSSVYGSALRENGPFSPRRGKTGWAGASWGRELVFGDTVAAIQHRLVDAPLGAIVADNFLGAVERVDIVSLGVFDLPVTTCALARQAKQPLASGNDAEIHLQDPLVRLGPWRRWRVSAFMNRSQMR